MKIKRNNGGFEGSSRKRGRFPVVPVIIAILLAVVLVMAWQRGGEKPLAPVEKVVPAEKLGQ